MTIRLLLCAGFLLTACVFPTKAEQVQQVSRQAMHGASISFIESYPLYDVQSQEGAAHDLLHNNALHDLMMKPIYIEEPIHVFG